MEREEGECGLSQKEKTILIGRKDREIEWQEVHSWSTGRRWKNGLVRVGSTGCVWGVHR